MPHSGSSVEHRQSEEQNLVGQLHQEALARVLE